MQDWIWPRGVKAESRRKLARLFGRLKVRFTRQRYYSEFPDGPRL